MRSLKSKLTIRPPNYFEHNERRKTPNIVQVDIMEWAKEPMSSTIIVEESFHPWLIARVKQLWKNRIKDSIR